MNTKKRNFTLVELLAVVAVIAILSGISMGVASAVRNSTAETQTRSSIQLIEMALQKYRDKTKKDYVIPDETVAAAIGKPLLLVPLDSELLKCFDGGDFVLDNSDEVTAVRSIKGIRFATVTYNSKKHLLILDGWNRPMIYLYPGAFNKSGVDIGSVGKDGRFGKNKDAALSTTKDLEVLDNGTTEYVKNTFLPVNLGQRNQKTSIYFVDFGKTGTDDITNFKN